MWAGSPMMHDTAGHANHLELSVENASIWPISFVSFIGCSLYPGGTVVQLGRRGGHRWTRAESGYCRSTLEVMDG
jgi:hypothetical protein